MILVGGVGQLFQGDLDVGRRAVERLRAEGLGEGVAGGGVAVEELHYGALAVAQRLAELGPRCLVLVGAAERGRPAGTVERHRIGDLRLTPDEVQRAVADAATGYVTLDLTVEVAWGLGALPERTVTIEVEPARSTPSEHLSPQVAGALEGILALVRAEVRRAPLLELAATIGPLLGDGHLEPAPALEAARALLAELEGLDRHGRWGRTFAARDQLRLAIARGETGEGMDHLDWGLWWALVEELDRLEAVEAQNL